MRRVLGWFLTLLGVGALLAGAGTAVAVGTDDTLELGPRRLTAAGTALATAPRVIGYSGLTLQLTATSADRASRVFLGVGHDVDVRDFLAGTAYTRIDSFALPWRVETSNVPGNRTEPPNPQGLSWWLTTAMHTGSVSQTLPLPDAPIDIVILDPDGAREFAVDLTVGVVVPGSFAGGLAVILAGAGLVGAGWAVRRRSPAGRRVRATREAAA